jgi:hypothetical protein
MVESYQPRIGTGMLPANTAAPLPAYPLPNLCSQGGATCGTSAAETAPQAPGSANNADPYNGHEWITNAGGHVDLNVDREYACIFQLTNPRDCSKNAAGTYTVPANGDACDCSSTTLTAEQLSPLCASVANPTSQTSAKAYPTIRELDLAYKMGTNGIVSSICPIDVSDNAAGNDPLYGYRPAVATIINRLKSALTTQCLPQTLQQEDGGAVPCLILVTLPAATNANNPEPDCASHAGYSVPNTQILQQYLASAEQQWLANDKGPGPDPKTLPTCQVQEITGLAPGASCKGSSEQGWCYVTGAGAGACAQAIDFSSGTLPTGAAVSLQCIESSSALAAGQEPDGG